MLLIGACHTDILLKLGNTLPVKPVRNPVSNASSDRLECSEDAKKLLTLLLTYDKDSWASVATRFELSDISDGVSYSRVRNDRRRGMQSGSFANTS